jgi:hypothetical protein
MGPIWACLFDDSGCGEASAAAAWRGMIDDKSRGINGHVLDAPGALVG